MMWSSHQTFSGSVVETIGRLTKDDQRLVASSGLNDRRAHARKGDSRIGHLWQAHSGSLPGALFNIHDILEKDASPSCPYCDMPSIYLP